ncbi:MAG TPA: hypothetical protein DHV17_07010 [Chitinophagaceae bacterium]|nr:hypothetical protein [Chitinophagaceae bacterium]
MSFHGAVIRQPHAIFPVARKIKTKQRHMKKILTLLFVLASLVSYSQSTTLVISQVYGAGGNAGAPLNADYVELHNISGVSQSLAGLSIQYASATNTNWTGVSALPSVSIPAGGYFLIQMSSTGTNGSPLPTVDYQAAPTIAMSATSGKVALVDGTTPLTGCPTTNVIDLVGYGTANCSETAPTTVLSVNDAAFRNNGGCTETNNNLSDFSLAAPAPRNSATPIFICGTPPPAPVLTITGTVNDFGNVTVGSSSASQSFSVSGTNLTGAPGNISITAPSTNFQVSLDNITWFSSINIPFTSGTLNATQVFVHFTPQSAGPQSGNISISGGGVSTALTVSVSGNGVAPTTPVISATGSMAFGSVCVNTVAGPNNLSISGSNLTNQDITVGPLAGYQFATAIAGPYSNSLTITQPGGTFSQTVYVTFNPTAVQSYNGSISINGGGIGAAVSVAATGEGVNTAGTVTTGSASNITTNSATLAGSITGTGCSAVTAYGVEYSTINGFVNGTVVNSTNLNAGNFTAALSGLAPATTYYYKAFITNAGGTVYGVQRSFITAAPPPPSLNATSLAAFGTICVNTTEGPNSFTLNGVNLSTANIQVGPLAGFTFSSSATGPFTDSLVITQTGGTFNQEIFVTFAPQVEQLYNGNIPVTGAGASSILVATIGAGINSTASLLTGDSLIISANIVEAKGEILDGGCSDVTSYGIEYSGINGFINGFGTKVPANNLNGGLFNSRLTGLVQNTIYYYKAYAVNNGGISYGSQRSFITPAIPGGLIIYGVPIQRGGILHYSLSGIKPGHYSVRIHNSVGQLVFQRDIIIAVNFIDESFNFPATLPMGLYNLEVRNHEFKIQKSFLVQ